ncbi:MAG: hypothetical protein C4B58_02085 [Deltaproteobacteria bacterium]|nr:MAG: hypothetical protein C4B58_02085 [Deltaproteobacteria bacterium]
MNICVIAWSIYLTDSRVRKYSEALVKRGDSVDVIALSFGDRKKPRGEKYNFCGVTVYEVDARREERKKLDYMISFLKFFLLSFYYVTKLYAKKKYAIIHVHTPPDFVVFSALIPKLFGAKIILDIHDPLPDFFSAKFGANKMNKLFTKFLCLVERVSAKFSDHVITITHYWKDVISKRSKIAETKISVILNLPDIELFNAAKFKNKKKSDDSFVLLYPGTLNKHCGVDIIIKAIALVKEQIPDLRFVIYGKGGELPSLQSIVRDLHLEDIVSFHNHVELDEVSLLMHNADLGIALLAGNNKYSKQALNVKLFEFLAMGLPAIATKATATEFYLNEDIVMFSQPNDPEDVARCISELFFNEKKRRELTRKGLNFINKNNWNLAMSDFFKIVDKLVTNK